MEITKTTSIEDLARLGYCYIDYISKKGIRCIRCGEPIWGTIEEASLEKGYSQEQIEVFVLELNNLISS